MIKEVNRACEKLNNTLGISVELPNPKKKALKTAAVCNFIVGAGLVAAGILFSSKSCAILGGISVISSVVLRKESENKAHGSFFKQREAYESSARTADNRPFFCKITWKWPDINAD